ncbi:MAG TPA: hypothetical protein VGQ44_13610 [Gemmatimonadaceae bacterium]|nr:hypothetical protein [Gemmatimonadaceae bacterium]
MTLGVGLLPIVPILLLPFILIIFVIVFPLWIVALGVVGLILLIVVGADSVARAMNVHSLEPAARGMRVAFRWVLTFGGLARSQAEREAEAAPITHR